MHLVRLIYASRPAHELSMDQIDAILEASVRKNSSAGITGILCYEGGYFLQCLEGSRDAVNELYRTIVRDERHHDAMLLQFGPIGARDFGSWAMGFVSSLSHEQAQILRHSLNEVFNPFTMTGENAHALLLELSKTMPMIPGRIPAVRR